MPANPRDLAQTTLGVLFIACLTVASLWVLQPFLAAMIWASTVVIASWPLMLSAEQRMGGRRWAAVLVMTLLLLLVLIVPLFMAIYTVASHQDLISEWSHWLMTATIPEVPEWVARIPLVGDKLHAIWSEYVASGVKDIAGELAPYAEKLPRWVLAEAGSIGLVFVQFMLTVIIASVMYANGDTYAQWLQRFGKRLAGERGESAVILAGQSIRGVAMGVVITALVQSVAGGIGLAIAGVPLAGMLAAVMLLLCIAQLGPMLVLIPAVGWLFWSGANGWGIFLGVWALVVGTMDNFIRPYLIKKGADLPLLLIFAGVIGGMVTLGLIGIFIGPVVLAVTYTLLNQWIDEGRSAPENETPEA